MNDPALFEIPTDPPTWLWAHTCREARCDCRAVFVLATADGREALIERGAPVHEVWRAGGKYLEAAWDVRELDAFYLHLDTAEPYWATANQHLNLTDHPRIGKIAARFDGELLDAIDRLWHQSKGRPDPQQCLIRGEAVMPSDWTPGDLIGWHDLCVSQRRDLYLLGPQAFEAMELYCPIPNCTCGETTLCFESVGEGDAPDPGHLVISTVGALNFHAGKRQRARLEQLWTAFCRRHPRYPERFARRDALVKTFGGKHVPQIPQPAVSKPKVGRNDPCPCGSNRKYKKCCGDASAA